MAERAGNAMETMTVDQSGVDAGTVAYMSPEQARGKELDARTDIFSFGVGAVRDGHGAAGVAGGDSAKIFDGIFNQPPVGRRAAESHLPADLDRILKKALEKDREVRYQRAADMRSDLKRLNRDTSSGAVVSGATCESG